MCTAILLGGCTGGGESIDPGLDTVRPSVSSDNRLALNRLALNRLALNRLALNSLSLGRMAMDELDETRWQLADDSALLGTEAGREVLTYVVKCALDPEDVMVGTVDGQTYEFRGLLGLARQWTERSLFESEQELLSGCLLAHVNAFGTPVAISLRADGKLSATDEERRDYSVYEGAFFGQIFEGDMTRAYSCQGSAAAAALAHSEDRAQRVCTDGSESCGIISVGRCRDVCDTRTKDMGWRDCWADGRPYQPTINVYLFADDAFGSNRLCNSQGCTLETGNGKAAILDCNGRWRCTAACTDGATCTIDGLDSRHVAVEVSGARMAEVDCYDSDDCDVSCNNGSSCDVECQAGESCDVDCSGGARCDVDCYRSDRCDVTCREGATCHVQTDGGSDSDSDSDSDSGWGRGWGWGWDWGRGSGSGSGQSGDAIECSAGASCHFECRSQEDCEVATCKQGASCLLECPYTDACEFDHCAGGATSCGDGVVACGRPCP